MFYQKVLKDEYIPKESGRLVKSPDGRVSSFRYETLDGLDIENYDTGAIIFYHRRKQLLFFSCGKFLELKGDNILNTGTSSIEDSYFFLMKPKFKKIALKCIL